MNRTRDFRGQWGNRLFVAREDFPLPAQPAELHVLLMKKTWSIIFLFNSPVEVLFDQAGLGQGKVGESG